MKSPSLAASWDTDLQSASWLDRLARAAVHRLLDKLENGCLQLVENGETRVFGDPDAELVASAVVTSPAAYREVAMRGSVGAGESYIAGYWHSPDPVKIIRLLCRNMKRLEELDSGFTRLARTLDVVKSRLAPNSLGGARKNIRAHYDLSNDLFACFLDQRMMYSSAVFDKDHQDLESAALNKLDHVATYLDVQPGDHVLEIGTGWGGMAVHLAEKFDCRVTTTTISKEQHEWATRLVTERGLEDRVTVLDSDYRELEGRFDRLVSIEMIEAVGHRYFPVFFKRCGDLLKPGGKMVLQAITIPENRYQAALGSVDFIQKYIFPGGCLPSLETICHHAGNAGRMQVEAVREIGLDYAETLKIWRQRFLAAGDQVLEMGFDNEFLRLWEFYLCYCEGGFRERSIGTVQVTLRKDA